MALKGDHGTRRSGTAAWLIQRASAIIIGLGLVLLVAGVGAAGSLDYQTWHRLLSAAGVRWLLGFWLLAVVVHAYLGLETIYRDYIHSASLRFFAYAASVLGLAVLLAFGVTVFLTWR